ncbi:MAG: hypothetical protein LBT25_03905 [Candidatus Symbiothrix sp.]|nr:hypothetical protein [Candidatus Symbiothrix sp.]
MKKYLFLFICVSLFYATTSAQNEDSSKIKTLDPEPKSSIFLDGSLNTDLIFFWKKKANKEHWSASRFTFINLDGLQDATIKQSKSYAFSLTAVEFLHAFNEHWLLVSGGELEWARYHFKGDIGLQGKSDITHFAPAPEGVSYKSSKLLAYYVNIPLVLEYQKKIGKKHTFFVDGGLEAQIKYYAKSQVDIRTPQGIEKTSLGRDLNFSPINARIVLQVGINDFGIFGYYQPFSLFEKGKGPDVRSFGIGISLN